MSDPTQMEKDIQHLVKQVKQLRKEKADLYRQLAEQDQQTSFAADRLPLSEISRITESTVHDIRNALGVIRNTIGFLSDDLTDNSHQADLQKINHSLDFCELLMRNLSSLSGQDIFQPEWVNVESIAREVYSMLERKLVDVDLTLDIDPHVPEIMADRGQIKQLFMNLIKNAGEAMPDGGTLTIHTRQEDQMLRIDITDTGIGISPPHQQKLFKEFFTTKEKGYGLGLYIVQSIVKRHGGTIAVQSESGKGAIFSLLLPIE